MPSQASYVHGASNIPLLAHTVGSCFDETANRFSDHDALIVPYQDIHWTWQQLKAQVDAYAAGFLALGLEPGQRLGIWAPNEWEWVVTQFASAKAGLILVNINPAYRMAELEYALERTGCAALITAPSLKTSNYIEMLNELLPELPASQPGALNSTKFPDLKILIRLGDDKSNGFVNFTEIPGLAEPQHHERIGELAQLLQFDDPINIQFTSGTTGAPKAATLTHHNIVNNAYFVGLQMKLTVDDRMCIPVPMYHCFGMVLGTLCCVAHGAAMVFASPGFDAHEVLQVLQDERCTVLHGVPTMFIAELDQADFSKFDLKTLRTGIMAGAPCPVELMKRVINEMNLTEITIAYGMTETGPVSFQTSVDDTEERRVNTVGQVLPHIEIKIIDDEGRIVPRGQTGELLTRGYCVMPEYWGDPEKTAKAIDTARWIASGDIATLDDDGYCQIVGRIKDMLIRGGENIFPREIEEFLYQHPKIEQAEVIGVPDVKYGEQVCAWIKLREGETATPDEIKQFCKDKIAHFKIPQYVKFVDEFPMTVTGKVQKYVMREIMTDELDLQQAAS
ncbi:MAG: AMP-binding protein [Rhizobiales bacterium]|nr:AMP-binding protein [Hyphomicrobiales bacterium]